MFNNALVCCVLGLSLFGAVFCLADGTALELAEPTDGVALKRVELFPAGQGVFEYESAEVGDVDLTLTLTRTELDDLLKSLVLKGFDTARVDYETNADRNSSISQVVSSDKAMTRSELLQGMKGHAIHLTDSLGSMSGVIVAVELQPPREKSGQDTEVITLRTSKGIEQRVLSDSTMFNLDDKAVQSQIDEALRNIVKPKSTRSPATIRLKKKDRGPAGFVFQTETAAWKCSYRIAKIDGEYQLMVSAVVDNNSGIDWLDVELVLVVDQPLGFHAPLSTVHRSHRILVPIPSPFSAAPPSLAAGAKRNAGQLLTDEPSETQGGSAGGQRMGSMGMGMGGMGMGGKGMGGMGGGGMGGMFGSGTNGGYGDHGYGGEYGGGEGSGYGGYSTPQTNGRSELGGDSQDVSSQLGMSFPVGDLSRALAGKRVHIRLPHVTIRAGESESVFLPVIPKTIEDVRVYSASISNKHPLSAFQITLQDGYQLPGGPGTVWSDSGYAGDIMFPRLVAMVPQMVTYALDTSIEVKSETSPEHSTKSAFRFDENETLIATKVSERRVRYSLSNDSNDPHVVSIEHRTTEQDWLPVPSQEQDGKPNQSNFRYHVNCPKQSVVSHDVLETKTTIAQWPKSTNWAQLKRLTLDDGMSQLVRERLEKRVAKLIEQESLQATETKLTKTRERAAAEQHRIKTLMEALNRQDELHARYLKKLFALENEIESTSEELITVRKKLEESTSQLMQESE